MKRIGDFIAPRWPERQKPTLDEKVIVRELAELLRGVPATEVPLDVALTVAVAMRTGGRERADKLATGLEMLRRFLSQRKQSE